MMDPATIFSAILAFAIASSIWDFYLAYRQYCVHKACEKRPVNIVELISEEDYAKARTYRLDKHKFGFVQLAFGTVKTIATFWYLAILWEVCGNWAYGLWSGGEEIWHSLIFGLTFTVLGTVLDLPFSLYDTFVIEQKHGFNRETGRFFFTDRVKKLLLSLIISAPINAAVVYIVKHIGGKWFFFYVWLFVSLVIFVMMTIYPEFIAPLFDKYTPLPESELKSRIEALASRISFPLKKLYVVEGSKRSAHSNAYMYGFWKNKRIVLYDTLLSKEMRETLKEKVDSNVTNTDEKEASAQSEGGKIGMSDDEVVAVLGHELGHWKLNHTAINLFIAESNLLLMLALFGYLYRHQALYAAFGFSTTQPVLIGMLIILSFVAAPYNEITSFAMVYLSRRLEFAADRFSAGLGQSEQLCSSLIKLGKDNKSLPVDDWLYSAVHHSHPPIPERIEALKKHM